MIIDRFFFIYFLFKAFNKFVLAKTIWYKAFKMGNVLPTTQMDQYKEKHGKYRWLINQSKPISLLTNTNILYYYSIVALIFAYKQIYVFNHSLFASIYAIIYIINLDYLQVILPLIPLRLKIPFFPPELQYFYQGVHIFFY